MEDQSFVVEKSWRQEVEEAGHTASNVGQEREMNANAKPTFSFVFIPRPPDQATVLPTVRTGFPDSANTS